MTQHNSQSEISKKSTKETVLSFIKALNEENFSAARKYMNDDFTFTGVLGSRNGADEYFNDMKKMKLKYGIKKVFVDKNDVCLFYDINMGAATVFGSGWDQLVNGKINSFTVVFDPRPVLENSQKK